MSRKSSIIASPHHEEIHELLASGWSPSNVHRYLVAQYGDTSAVPSVAALKRYRARHMPPAAFVPGSMIRQALGGLRYRVDTLKTMDELIWAQEQRIALGWRKEQETGRLDPQMTDALRIAMDYMRERHRLAAELGVERPGGGRVTARQTQVLEMPESTFQEVLGFMEQRRRQIEQGYALGPVIPTKALPPYEEGHDEEE